MTDERLILRYAYKDIKWLKSKAKSTFQKWCRERDEGEPCISCGTMDAKWDGGHYFKAELYSSLIFNEMNVNKQCAYCNSWSDGNIIGYRRGLIKKYGKKKVNELEDLGLADKRKAVKRTKMDYINIILRYR